ncbi:MAG: FKBP-type peptidyl-prolyl cis-trans isomerase [Terricaulis sp.]
MIKYLMVAAALALSACGQTDTGVMSEMEKADKADAQHQADVEQAAAHAGEANAAFLASVRAKPGIQALPSGVLLEFKHHSSAANLPHPTAQATVLVHYEGKLSNGEVFDSSFQRGQPAPFPLNQVVDGFAEAIEHMRPGDEVIATIPAELGYGPSGQPPVIPPNAVLQFRIILLALQEPGHQAVRAPQHG